MVQQYQGKVVDGGEEKEKKEYRCGKCKTKLSTVNHYFCEQCKKLYCLKHRHQESHECKEDSSCASCHLI